MNPFLDYVRQITQSVKNAQNLAVAGCSDISPSENKVLMFSPHPDDECIVGLLPLRLQRELSYEVVNVPMTFGSLRERRKGRLEELTNACRYLGWNNHLERDDLENLTVGDVVLVLDQYQPKVLVFPHSDDWNTRHIEVHEILMKALALMPPAFSCLIVESEFWNTMKTPNCIVEASEEDLATLMAATSFHIKEVERNPYHLTLPAWMIDNVRRGAELIGGQGRESPSYLYGTLYRMQQWENGALSPLPQHQSQLSKEANSLNYIKSWK